MHHCKSFKATFNSGGVDSAGFRRVNIALGSRLCRHIGDGWESFGTMGWFHLPNSAPSPQCPGC